ncbi:DMT family transporter [Litoribrevibacter euphylliae]|uniref:DMT family transporter n=1 Tax=Litoribrevibacter euphylliae TaxID=1834034 RepID=A0ABV7HMI1_9GAMM
MNRHLTANTRTPFIALVLAMFIWASSFIALKISFDVMHPAQVLFFRMLSASVCFLLLIRWMRPIQYQKGDWKFFVPMVVMEPCLYFIFESIALQNTTASQAGVVTSLLPLLTAVGAVLALKERMNPIMWIGFLMAMVGAVLLSLTSDSTESAPNPILGNFFEFLAMVCAAGYTLIVKHLITRYSALFLTALQSWTGALFFLGPALYFPMPDEIGVVAIGSILYLGVFVSIGAYGLYNYAMAYVPATQASAFINLIPVFTVMIAFVVLDERLNLYQLMACGLVVLGLVINHKAESKAKSSN